MFTSAMEFLGAHIPAAITLAIFYFLSLLGVSSFAVTSRAWHDAKFQPMPHRFWRACLVPATLAQERGYLCDAGAAVSMVSNSLRRPVLRS